MRTRPTLAAAMTALTIASLLACGSGGVDSAATATPQQDVPVTVESINREEDNPVEEARREVDPSSSVSGSVTMLPPSADVAPITLRYEVGHTATILDGTLWVSFGAVIENPADEDVYDVELQLAFVDADDIMRESTSYTLPSLPAGRRERFSYTGPVDVEGFHSLTFEVSRFSYTGAAGVAPARPAPIDLHDVRIEAGAHDLGVLGRVMNPGPGTIDEAAVFCVLRSEGRIVGGAHLGSIDELTAGQQVDLELRIPVVPTEVDEADCEASAVGPADPA